MYDIQNLHKIQVNLEMKIKTSLTNQYFIETILHINFKLPLANHNLPESMFLRKQHKSVLNVYPNFIAQRISITHCFIPSLIFISVTTKNH